MTRELLFRGIVNARYGKFRNGNPGYGFEKVGTGRRILELSCAHGFNFVHCFPLV